MIQPGAKARSTSAQSYLDAPYAPPIVSRRDFFIHLFTITCGLLIALSLEGLVEWSHHRALVNEARTNIRREIVDNQKAAKKNLAMISNNLEITRANLATEKELQEHPKTFMAR